MAKENYKTESGRNTVLSQYRKILTDWPVANKQYPVNTSQGSIFVIESGEQRKPALNYTMLITHHFKPRMEKLLIFPDHALQALTIPIQLICGERDFLLKSEQSIERMRSLVENLEASLLTDTDHVIANQGSAVQNFLNANEAEINTVNL